MTIKKLVSYLMIASALVLLNTSCSQNEENTLKEEEVSKPVEKTAEEIAAENLAELKTIIGKGIGNNKYELADPVQKTIDELTTEDFQKLKFNERESDISRYFKFEGENFVFLDSYIKIQSNVFSLDKKDGVFSLLIKKEDLKNVTISDAVQNHKDYALKVTLNTKTEVVTTFLEMNIGASNLLVTRYKKRSYDPKSETQNRINKRNIIRNNHSAFSGVKPVKVRLQPKSGAAFLAQIFLSPAGNHYVKFTPLSNGKTQIQFCRPNGTVSGNRDSDYLVTSNPTTTTGHFWANNMPMALNLYDVNFTYSNGTISAGTSARARARRNGRGLSNIPGVGVLANQDSRGSQTIITSRGNSVSNFKIEIKLDFLLDFHCVIESL